MKIVNHEEFNETIKSGAVIVDFYADWCGPCKMIAPVLEDLSKAYPQVQIIKVNVDNENELAKEYGIMSIPAIYAFKDGEVVDQAVGFLPKPALEKLINSIL